MLMAMLVASARSMFFASVAPLVFLICIWACDAMLVILLPRVVIADAICGIRAIMGAGTSTNSLCTRLYMSSLLFCIRFILVAFRNWINVLVTITIGVANYCDVMENLTILVAELLNEYAEKVVLFASK